MSKRDTVFVCPACGKTALSPAGFSDVSCATWSVKCYVDSIKRDDSGRIVGADAVPK